jgi:nitrogen fixation protein FixH
MLDKPADFASLQQRIDALLMLGVPYGDIIDRAEPMARDQAREIAKQIVEQGGPTGLEDPSFALESDYYRKAVSWDAQRELDRESAALGWQAQLEASPAEHTTRLRVQLKDASGDALTGSSVRVQAFANARAARQFEVALAETAHGIYEGELPSPASGLWEFRLEAARSTARFAKSVRLSVESASL